MRRSILRSALPIVVTVAAAGALAWVWLVYDELRQNQFLSTVVIVGVAGILLLLWALLLSGWSARRRGAVLLAAVASVAGFLALYRVEEVSGDLIPRFVSRWAPKADELLPALESTPSSEGATTPAEPVVVADLRATTPRDWPRFLGAGIDAVVDEPAELAVDWAASPPRRVWTQEIGAGWSSFAVVGDFAVTQEQRGAEELVVCYRWRTGEVIWSHAESVRFDNVISGAGPRATPTIVDGRIYAMGATGILVCLEGATGELLWRREVLAENGAEAPEWGVACSPLVHDGLAIVAAGGAGGRSLVAYDALSGEPRWRGGDDAASYASPQWRYLAGAAQIVVLNHSSVTGHDPQDGAVLWRHPWPGHYPKVTQPVVLSGDRVLVTSGYGVGAELLQVTTTDGRWRAESLWRNNRLKSKFANVIAFEQHAYGLDDGYPVCIEIATGKRLWKAPRIGHGQLLRVGDLILATTEDGEVLLLRPLPSGYDELTRFHAVDGKTWNHPVLIGRFLLVRNSSTATCWELPLVAAE